MTTDEYDWSHADLMVELNRRLVVPTETLVAKAVDKLEQQAQLISEYRSILISVYNDYGFDNLTEEVRDKIRTAADKFS